MKTANFKRMPILILSFLIAIMTLNAQTKKNNTIEKVKFNVPMDCKSCQIKIEKNIVFEKGIKALEVNLEKNTVDISYDSRKTNIEKIQNGFKKIGYEANLIDTANNTKKSTEKPDKMD